MSETAEHRTRDDVASEIHKLSDADWGRLRATATAFARGRPIEAEDLLQESFRRALDGSRNCPSDVSVVRFLAEAMRSIAHSELEKANRRPLLTAIGSHGDELDLVDPPDQRSDSEQQLAVKEMKAALLALFEGDDVAQVMLEGIMEGMEGEELRDLTGLNPVEFNSKRRLIRRRINKEFPEGWKP